MKIALIGSFSLYFVPRVNRFNEDMKARGHELYVIENNEKSLLYSFASDDKSSWNRLIVANEKGKNYEAKLINILERLQPDVIVTGFVSFPFGAIPLRWAKANNRAIVEYDNQRWNTFPRGRFSQFIKRRLLRNVDAFLCPSEAWDATLFKYGFKKAEIFYGLNTSDNEFWSEPPEKYSFTNLPEEYFLTVGRQMQMKNLPKLVAAYRQYCEEGGCIPLVMVGEGTEHDEIVRLGKGLPITFLPYQNREKIKELFTRMRALLLPSYKLETWGMVVNECMPLGGIIGISSECGSATTLVKEGVNGFQFSPHEQSEIVKVLHKLSKLSEEERMKMSEASKRIVKDWGTDRFSNELYAACLYALDHKKKVKNIFDKLLIAFWKGRYNLDEVKK